MDHFTNCLACGQRVPLTAAVAVLDHWGYQRWRGHLYRLSGIRRTPYRFTKVTGNNYADGAIGPCCYGLVAPRERWELDVQRKNNRARNTNHVHQ